MIKLALLILCVSLTWAVPHKIETRSISNRIVGGIPARAAQFPFAAAIYITTPGGNYFCGGALVNNDWVLTAGQCVDGATLFTIKLGTNSLQDTSENVLTLATETYVLHPEYNPTTLEHDLGAIKFRSYVTLTDYIRPVYYMVSTALPDSSIVITLGWGQTNDASAGLSDELNYTFLTTVTNQECRIYYGPQVTDNMVCVAGSFNEGTCIGDSGTPLIQYAANGQAYHVGISSFYSGNGCESFEPSGYTRVAPYREWIRNVTGA